MSTFGKTFSETTPLGSALANTLDTIIQDDKVSINERLKLEHNALDSTATGATTIENSAAQGRHIPGKVSAIYIGTTTQINALTGMMSGAMAYDTTAGVLRIYNGTNWTAITISGLPTGGTELLVSIFGSAALAAAAATTAGAWTTAPTTMVNIFDQSVATNWGEAYLSGPDAYAITYFNLAAIYQGHILLVGQMKTTARAFIAAESGYSETDGVIEHFASMNAANAVPAQVGTGSTTYKRFSILTPFYGQYVSLRCENPNASGTIQSYFKIERFEIYGSAV